MKNRLLLLITLCVLSHFVIAQTQTSYTVKGVLLDSLTLQGEPYATIKIVPIKAPDKAVKMAVTDNKGRFQENFPAANGQYTITITSIVRQPIVKDFELDPNKAGVDFGTLYIVQATTALGK